MATLLMATTRELKEIAQDFLPQMWNDDALFKRLVPYDFVDTTTLEWEQKDNFTGLMDIRTYDTGFAKVDREGVSQYLVRPGVYGNHKTVWEGYLANARKVGAFGEAIDLQDVQVGDMVHLMQRAFNRVRQIVMQLLTTRQYAVTDRTGAKTVYADNFPFQTFASSIAWSNLATATPIADLEAMQLLHRGHSIRFDNQGELWINQTQANYLFNNTNPNDLGNRRVYGVGDGPTLDIDGVNKVMLAKNLPKIVVYDEGYNTDPVYTAGVITTPSTFQLFIPTGTGILVGRRTDGAPLMDFAFTRNPNNLVANREVRGADAMGAGMAQIYVDWDEKKNPWRGITTVGFNGAPRVWYPASIVVATL